LSAAGPGCETESPRGMAAHHLKVGESTDVGATG